MRLRTLNKVRARLNPRLQIKGFVCTMFDGRTRLSRQILDEVRRHFAEKVYKTVIPKNVRVSEAPSFGKPVIAYDIVSRGAQAYLALAQEVIDETQR